MDLRVRFIKDVIEEILKTQDQGDEVIIGMDINPVLSQDLTGIEQMIRKCALFELLSKVPSLVKEPPAEYKRSGCIDYLLGTEGAHTAVVRGGYLPYGEGFTSNHREIFVEVNIATLLEWFNTIPMERQRFIQTKNVYAIQHYKNFLMELFSARSIIQPAAEIEKRFHNRNVPKKRLKH